ncbi:MAG: Wzz/FepE/Etk N-terminal domain-containing protein [Pseudomonadota bacterium]
MEQLEIFFDFLRMIRRRALIITSLCVLGFSVTWGVLQIVPPTYQAKARILVESQQIPTELARSTVAASASERLQLIQQRLLARDNLVHVIDKHGLFSPSRGLKLAQKIELLRAATAIVPTTVTGRSYGATVLTGITIQVTLGDPDEVAAIANDFADIVLRQNASVRSRRASETLSFFRREEARLTTAVFDTERDIALFKQRNKGALPESLEFRRDELSRLSETELELDRRVLEIEESRGELDARLRELQLEPQPMQDSPDRQSLSDLQLRLAQQRTIFAENHRTIVALKSQIGILARKLSDREPSPQDEVRVVKADALGRQITLLDNQLGHLASQKAGLTARAEELRMSVRQTPEVELSLSAFERRRLDLQDQLSAIITKRAEAETGEKLEVNQQAERFELIERAHVPDRPISPNRKKIVVVGGALSIAMAIGIAFMLETLRPAIRTSAQLRRHLDLRAVVAIPHIRTRGERRWRIARVGIVIAVVCGGLPALLQSIGGPSTTLAMLEHSSDLDELALMIGLRQ